MRFLAGIAILILGLILVFIGIVVSMTSAQGGCIDDRRDQDRNCVINSLDLLIVAMGYGTVEPEATPSIPIETETPTATPTEVASSTSTITPTSTEESPSTTPTPSATTSATETASSTTTPQPSSTPTATSSSTATATQTFTSTATATMPPTSTSTHTSTPSPTSTRSPTATTTPTRTPTPTPTPSSTPTLSPSGYTIANLIADTTGRNDGTLCPPVNTYNWGIEGHGLYGEPPEGDQITGWWTAQWISCGASGPGVVLEIRNFRVLGLKTSWLGFMGDWDDWCATTDPNTTSGYAGCTFSGAGVAMPTGQRALHGASSRMADQNVDCVIVVYEARYTGNTPIMVNAGADHIAGGNILGDMFISKYKRLTNTGWTKLGGSSCSSGQLIANPPPL